ncbi:hypothetical protein AVEN_240325-1 [Araneus ventricosus]|uniref:Uncharacterized protein n=1 Tax=Araneus ventricosus TaxID=182803 RepID=A0A4Y2RIV1_ARAVE|nr:hypothetical protein AVEN_240325-1 [Araneus ventricosus]
MNENLNDELSRRPLAIEVLKMDKIFCQGPQLDQVQESARPQKTIGERFMVKEKRAASAGTRPWTPEGRSPTLSIAFML